VAPPQKDGADSDDKSSHLDWSELYADLLCHTSISYFEIHEMTIPVIQAIRKKIGKHIEMTIGIPGLFGGALDTPTHPSPSGRPPKLSEFMNLANAFNGI
jgi:hypothetical protein